MRDLSKLRAAKEALDRKGTTSYNRLKIGKEVEVRILPYKFDADFEFFESHQFFGWEKYPITAPRTFGKDDPAQDLARQLWNDGDQDTARKLNPTRNFSCWVLEIGKEDEGPKLWSMSKTVYESVLNVILDEDEYGDVTSLTEGRNFTIKRGEPAPGQSYGKFTVQPKVKTTEVLDKEEAIEKQVDWKEVFQESEPALILKHLDRIISAGTPTKPTEGVVSAGGDDEAFDSLKDEI